MHKHHDPDDDGQGLVEYALLIILIGIFAMLVTLRLGTETNDFYDNTTQSLSTIS